MPFFIPVSAQFSNAVLVAILPFCSDFSKKLDLPVSLPIQPEHVSSFTCDPREASIGGLLKLKNGYEFSFDNGFVNLFRSPRCYSAIQNPDEIRNFYGKVNLSKKQAQALAVESLAHLGYPLDNCFVEPSPKVTNPARLEGKVVPRYQFEWFDPSSGKGSIEMEVNAESKRIEMLWMSSRNFWREPPRIQGYDYNKARSRSARIPQNVALTQSNLFALEKTVFPAVSEYVTQLGWPVETPVTTNQLRDVTYQPDAHELHLCSTNGYRFVFADGYVRSVYVRNSFFAWEPPARIKDYVGKWKISEAESVALARETLAKLGYSGKALGMDVKPRITKPVVKSIIIPRYLISWQQSEGGILDSAAEVEVDAQNEKVTSIYVFDSQKNKEMPHIELSSDASRGTMIYRTNSPAKSQTAPPH